jgi:DNA-binding MarR family transcriptional regulator
MAGLSSQNSRPQVPPIDSVHVSIDTLRSFVGYHIKRVSNVVQSDLALTLKPFDLRMITYSALVLVVDNPGLRQSQLADALAIERPNLVVIVDELEGRALIVRDKVPTDRRAYALRATLKGQVLNTQAIAAVRVHENKLLDGISGDERATLLALLLRMETVAKKGVE